MKFPSIFKPTDNAPAAAATTAWAWPSCANSPRTLSFRDCKASNILKTSNSAFLQHNGGEEEVFHCNLLGSPTNSFDGYDSTAEVAAGLLLRSSDRLTFEPGETNSILEEAKAPSSSSSGGGGGLPEVKEESVTIVAMDSSDPFLDFRVSMEEMILAHGIKDWECLEDLLTCYLKVNVKSNHGYVIGAFMDLLVNLSLANCDEEDDEGEDDDEQCGNSSCHRHLLLHHHEGSFTSPLSFCSSSCSFNSPSMEVSEGRPLTHCSSFPLHLDGHPCSCP